MPLLRPGATLWNTEAYGPPRRLVSRWLAQRAAGVERFFPFIYHMPVDDASLGLVRFGLYPINVDYTPRADAVALRTLSDLVGSAAPTGAATVGLGFSVYGFSASDRPTLALVDGNEAGLTWLPASAVVLRVSLPRGVRRVEVIDLMGNREVRRVRRPPAPAAAGRGRVPATRSSGCTSRGASGAEPRRQTLTGIPARLHGCACGASQSAALSGTPRFTFPCYPCFRTIRSVKHPISFGNLCSDGEAVPSPPRELSAVPETTRDRLRHGTCTE
jgi:hypothetical protein